MNGGITRDACSLFGKNLSTADKRLEKRTPAIGQTQDR